MVQSLWKTVEQFLKEAKRTTSAPALWIFIQRHGKFLLKTYFRYKMLCFRELKDI
jgi:hypothetical protein